LPTKPKIEPALLSERAADAAAALRELSGRIEALRSEHIDRIAAVTPGVPRGSVDALEFGRCGNNLAAQLRVIIDRADAPL
jgi:hypothetical protein